MKKQRQRYTYIPNEEIAEITTFNDVTIEGKDLLDGAYAKGRRKYAHGGETGQFKKNGNRLMYFEPINQREEIVAFINNNSKIVSPAGSYYLPNPIAKSVIKWAHKNGYDFVQDDKKYERGGGIPKKRYTYIPKDEIAEITTFNDITIKGKDLLDGAYAKGRRKYAHGGETRPMSMEQQAAEAVGDDVWFSLEDREKSELVEELVRSGTISATGSSTDRRIMELIEQNDYYANGGIATAGKFKVKYYLKESPNEIKEKFFDDKDRADFFFETIQEDEDIVVMPMELMPEKVVAEKPKSKSLFSSAKPVPETTAASRKKRERVQVDGISDEIARYDQLKAAINNAKAEQELIGGRLKEIGRDKFLEIYEQRGFRPANFDLADGEENILLEVTDKYLKVEPEKAAILEQYSGLLETKTTYEFNAEILEKEVSSGMTVGDVVSMLIQDSKLLSDSDKENLIKAKTTMRVPKGTIDRLMDYDNPREVFNLISPILALK